MQAHWKVMETDKMYKNICVTHTEKIMIKLIFCQVDTLYICIVRLHEFFTFQSKNKLRIQSKIKIMIEEFVDEQVPQYNYDEDTNIKFDRLKSYVQ